MSGSAPVAAGARERLDARFYLLWLGQSVSAFGAMLTTFALGVWLFQRTGSLFEFCALVLCASVPPLILLPWSERLTGRADQRLVLIGCELAGALCLATLATLAWSGSLAPRHLLLAQLVLSTAMAFQGPAAQAAIVALVPYRRFGRASALFAASGALTQLGAPLLAAFLLVRYGLGTVLWLGLLGFGVVLLALMLARLPALRQPTARDGVAELGDGMGFLIAHPTLALVYCNVSLGGLLAATLIVLLTPALLAGHSVATLALVSSAGALGAILSGVLMLVWGGPRRWTPLLLGLNVMNGLALALAGASSALPLLCVSAFLVMFGSSTLSASVQQLWRRQVPPSRQGGIAAVQMAVALALVPLVAALAAGQGGEPGALARAIGFDSAARHGAPFLFFVIGIASAAVSLLAMTSRRLHRLETEQPTAV